MENCSMGGLGASVEVENWVLNYNFNIKGRCLLIRISGVNPDAGSDGGCSLEDNGYAW